MPTKVSSPSTVTVFNMAYIGIFEIAAAVVAFFILLRLLGAGRNSAETEPIQPKSPV